jgi:hypothetical protein
MGGFEFRPKEAYLQRAGEYFHPDGLKTARRDPGFIPSLARSREHTGRNGGRDEWAEAHFLLLEIRFEFQGARSKEKQVAPPLTSLRDAE